MIDKTDKIYEVIKFERRLNHALRQYAPDAWMNLGLTIGQLKSLFFIANEGTTNFRKLAAALGVTPSNVTGIVDRLAEQGLVTRNECPQDRRIVLLQATQKGETILAKLRERRRNHMVEILSHLNSEELSTVTSGLKLMVKAAETDEREKKDNYPRNNEG